MTKFEEKNRKERHMGFETAQYHIGRGKFIRERSHIAQQLLENYIEIKNSNDIYIETNRLNAAELSNLIINNNSKIEFTFDCNMVLESQEGAVVTGDLKSLEYDKSKKTLCTRTADSVLCFELE